MDNDRPSGLVFINYKKVFDLIDHDMLLLKLEAYGIQSKELIDVHLWVFKVTVDLRGVFWGKQYSALYINGNYINLYIIAELM